MDWNAAVNLIMQPFAEAVSGGDKKKEKTFIAKGFEFASNMMVKEFCDCLNSQKECEASGESAYNSSFAFEEQAILKQCEQMILRDVSQFKHINVSCRFAANL